jgi:hypothetical protein
MKTNLEILDILNGHSDDFLIDCANDLQMKVVPDEFG